MSKASQLATRRNRLGMAELRLSAIFWHSGISEGDQKFVGILDLKSMREKAPTDNLHWAIDRLDHKWCMTLITVGVQPCGRENYSVVTEKMAEHYSHKNLVEYFNEQHQSMLDKINPKFGQKAAWIATLEYRDWSESEIQMIMEIK